MIALGMGIAPTAQAAAPVGSGFTVTAADLAYILRQIKISEAHVANTTSATGPCGALVGTGPDQVPDAITSYGLRTVDGSCNNLVPGREKFGAADPIFPRLTTPSFKTAEADPGLFGPPGGPVTDYAQHSGFTFDTQPRVISNLIVDQSANNPAAIAAAGHPVRVQANAPPGVVPCTTDPTTPGGTDGFPAGCTPSGQTLFIPNVTTDVGLSPPYNSLFTIFGQFFDHGLDKITNDPASGTVVVPLQADDPLIPGADHILGTPDDLPPQLRFMVLTRGQEQAGPDHIVGTADDIHDSVNTDTPWVDLSQAYTSHPSHQVFLRQYEMDANGHPQTQGRLLGSPDGTLATWKLIKAQAATKLGLKLVDTDVADIPMLDADAYGDFVPGPHGLPQYVTTTGLVEGNLANPVPVPSNGLHIETAFLNDIAHSASPTALSVTPQGGTCGAPGVTCKGGPDADNTAGLQLDVPVCPVGVTGCYDDELLDAHFIAGDGRANENIGLTTIHNIFEHEHNRLVADIENTLTTDTTDLGIAALPEWKTATSADGWNGSRIFQAARFVTEMEYQHLVFEEFVRKVQPAVRPFHVYSPDQNPAIPAEFAHAVYRFGHSMLDDVIPRIEENGSRNDIPLLDGFLNPPAYTQATPGGPSGVLNGDQAAGAIAMGLSDQVGNELDEFINNTLRNNLLGLPLDLATLNMARARSEGIPSLNNVRKQIFAQTNDGQLAPYTNWIDFGLQMKHPESLINFVAAYGQHPTILTDAGADHIVGTPDDGPATLASRRAAATQLVNPDPFSSLPIPADAGDFMASTGAWANTGANNDVSITGLDNVDLWVGGLAERVNLFGGLLGSTFNYVFEYTTSNLQDFDRFYYLNRTPGMQLRTQLEGNSFAEMIMRNTTAHSLKADSFGTADCKFQLSHLDGTAAFYQAHGSTVADDPATECDETALLIRMPDGTIRYRTINSVDPAGINGQSVYNGTAGADRIWGGIDNDTILGNEGPDVIQGSDGDDNTIGGDGNDIITDSAGADVLKGGPGNDALDGGIGNDIVLGGTGSDFVNGGANDNESFVGEGNDFVMAGQGADAVFGGSGDDWIEGGTGQDLLQGENGAPFFDDPDVPGSDVLVGQPGENDYDAEGGNDIMEAYPAIERNAGAAGWDWVSHQYDTVPADDDMNINQNLIGLPIQQVVNRDRWQETEADSGGPFNDVIHGDDRIWSTIGGAGFTGCDALDQAAIDQIQGLDPLIPPLTTPTASVLALTQDQHCPLKGAFVWGEGNVIIGGPGSDLLEGRGGDDVIDGDRYLQVAISVTDGAGTEFGTTDLMENVAKTGNFGPGTAGMTLQQAVFAGKVDPGNLKIKRAIITPPVVASDVDTARFSDVLANYTLSPIPGPDHKVIVSHLAGAGIDGTDTVTNIERLQFADQTVNVGAFFDTPASGVVTISSTTPTEGVALTADASGIIDPDGFNPASVALTWQAETTPGSFVDVGTGSTFTPTNAEVGFALRVVASFTDNFGVFESVISDPTGPVANVNDPPVGVPTLSTNAPQSGTSLTASTAGISDPDGLVGVTFAFQWQANGVNIPGATNATFTPTAAQVGQTLRVVVSFTDNHGTAEQVISASTAAVTPPPVPLATITPASLAFGNRAVGTTSANQAITITNSGSGVLAIASATRTGTNPNQFALTNNCTTLVSGASCTINVRFAPTSTGAKTASVTIVHNAAGSPQVVTLTGTGVPAAPAVSLSTTSVAFGNQTNGTTSAARVVTVTNTGTANLVVAGVTRTGTNPNQFTSTTNCATVVPGGSCTATVRFAPTSAGAKSATLNISSNAVGSPHLVSLTGTGVVPVPSASVPATLAFGNVNRNTTATQNLTVTNNGPGTLTVSSASTNNARFTVTLGTCVNPVGAGNTCRLSVSFRPIVTGNQTATLTVNSNASNSPGTTNLTGRGR